MAQMSRRRDSRHVSYNLCISWREPGIPESKHRRTGQVRLGPPSDRMATGTPPGSEELGAQASGLRELVGRFKVDN